MAASLLLLLDDIASVLDDVALLTKVAAKKTAGVIGDDLALNAHQVAGIDPRRELGVVWRVAWGSLGNKAILVPAALALSWLAPWAVTPLLVLGGLYLCFEGMEKILHVADRRADDHTHDHGAEPPSDVSPMDDGPAASEETKIAGAIRTDFILSAEIIVITLGIVAGQPPGVQVAVLALVALAMTVGVYGLVAGIVRLDDLGLALAAGPPGAGRAIGRAILGAAPWLLRGLSVAGTAAMFVVGGGILAHALPALHAFTTPGGHGESTRWWAPLASVAAEATVVLRSNSAMTRRAVTLDPAAPVRSLREAADLSQRDLAGARGISQHTVLDAERAGARVQIETLAAYVEAAGYVLELRARPAPQTARGRAASAGGNVGTSATPKARRAPAARRHHAAEGSPRDERPSAASDTSSPANQDRSRG